MASGVPPASSSMNRLDRYYIPAGVPARPPAPPLPRKGILMMPPPPPPPNTTSSNAAAVRMHVHHQQAHPQQQNWSYQSAPGMQHAIQQYEKHKSSGAQSMPDFMNLEKIGRPERMGRRPLPRLYPPGMENYEELPALPPPPPATGPPGGGGAGGGGRSMDSQNLATAMAIPDASPRLALQRILVLYENGDHREAAAFMRRLSFQTFKQVLPHLPADIFIESMPHSLPILEALYAKLFLGSGNGFDHANVLGRANSLRPEAVVWQLVKFFAGQEAEGAGLVGQMRWEFCGPFISSCKRLLTVILAAEPRARRVLFERKRSLMKAIEGLGQHGLVGTSDEQLVSLHDALKAEFKKVQKSYTDALQKLESMSLVHSGSDKSGNGGVVGGISAASGGKAPIAQSHQRQLSLKSTEIQERLIKNKTLLNLVEPTLENTSLEILLGILQQRIELDKECLFQFTQVKKQSLLSTNSTSSGGQGGQDQGAKSSVAPILMRYQRGCQQVLDLMKEVSEEKDIEEEGDGSDISGYHSDSESAVMTSGNSPFISKEARFSFLSRSVRLGSKHNVRASILASSLCLAGGDTASLRTTGSIKSGCLSHRSSGSTRNLHHSSSLSGVNLHNNSSSGVSSGSTTGSSENGDKSGGAGGPGGVAPEPPGSPTPSAGGSSVNTVVMRRSSGGGVGPQGPASTAGSSARSTPRPRHMKARKEVFKSSVSTTGSVKSSGTVTVGQGCAKCGGDTASVATSASVNGEPIYQGINDITVIRKDNEIAGLKSNVTHLRSELAHAQKTIFAIKDAEALLKEKLAQEKQRAQTLEKLATAASAKPSSQSPQLSSSSSSSSSSTASFSPTLDQRPANLVRKYGGLYSQTRLETLDNLDKLPQLVSAEELKNKLLFSVMVLAFRSVQSTMQNKREQIRRILQLPPPTLSSSASSIGGGGGSGGGSPSTSGASSGSDCDDTVDIKANSVIGKPFRKNDSRDDCDTESVVSVVFSNAAVDPKVATDMEDAISLYLRRATENFDLSKNVEEVCSQIWATLYDYPCLKSCDAIIKYIKECVRVAWGLVNQAPAYHIEYENRHFRPDLHVRFHSSDPKYDQIRTYLWPALREGRDGPCVQKGVVIT